jgi:acetolactate synthase-1/2/3 large subunit
MSARSGGKILVDALRANGAELIFGIPGESFVAALDALYDVAAPRFILCRHESAAAHAAEAYGKMTGRPGLCYVTRGPGASHAAVGVHTARQDSTPMILFVGQIVREHVGREAWQEIDVAQMFGGMAKWAAQVDEARRIPEFVQRAYAVALGGRPGPVVLAIPEDVLDEQADVDDVPAHEPVRASPAAADLERMRAMLAGAQRPLVLAGGGGWDESAYDGLRAFAERNGLPVATAFRRQALFDNDHPLYAGVLNIAIDPKLAARVRAADVILAIGARLDDVTTGGYALIEAPVPQQRLIHVYPGAGELGRVFHPALAIESGPAEFVAALAQLAPLDGAAWRDWAAGAHADYVRRGNAAPSPGRLDMVAVMATLQEMLPPDAILTTGAGNYTAWSQRFYRYTRFGTQVTPISGSMGYGIPAALAAKLVYPERVVIAFEGDGCFQMCGHELGTARQYGLPIVVILVDNGIHGAIRVHQERHFPGRVIGTDIVNPDFVAYARAYGAPAELVETAAAFGPALQRALDARLPAVLVLRLDPEAITPDATLAQIRARAEASRAAPPRT